MAAKIMHIWWKFVFAIKMFLVGRFWPNFHQNYIIRPRSFQLCPNKIRKIGIFLSKSRKIGKLLRFLPLWLKGTSDFQVYISPMKNLNTKSQCWHYGKEYDVLTRNIGQMLWKLSLFWKEDVIFKFFPILNSKTCFCNIRFSSRVIMAKFSSNLNNLSMLFSILPK